MMRSIGYAMGVLFLAGCGGEDGGFTTASDDEALETDDPPSDPDPLAADQCATANKLSPGGLTFVLHVSKNSDNATREVEHLQEVKAFIRPRDVFMVEHGSPAVTALRQIFPCNRFHYIAFPGEMKAALATGDGIEGIAVDWEGGAVANHSYGWNVSQLHSYSKDIHARGKMAGFVPFWAWETSDGAATDESNMDYAIAQIQNACVTSPEAFANKARSIAKSFHPARNVGFEISLDSYASADNHVSAERASKCTRKAYGKGARAIYIYGNGHDHLPDYFHELHKMGVRSPR